MTNQIDELMRLSELPWCAATPGSKASDEYREAFRTALEDALKPQDNPLWPTLVRIAEHLGIDPEEARKAPGKPSDVYIAAIEAALGQPQAVPASSLKPGVDGDWLDDVEAALVEPEQDDMPNGSNCKWPACQTEEYQQMLCKEIAQSLGIGEQSEQSEQYESEPVAWRWSESNGERWFNWTTDWKHHERAKSMGCLIEYVYTAAPPRREPLSDTQAKRMVKVGPVYGPWGVVTRRPEEYRKELEDARLAGIRIAEAAHGITGGNNAK